MSQTDWKQNVRVQLLSEYRYILILHTLACKQDAQKFPRHSVLSHTFAKEAFRHRFLARIHIIPPAVALEESTTSHLLRRDWIATGFDANIDTLQLRSTDPQN